MFGVNGYEFIVLAVVGLIVLGPDKLPKYIADAAQMIRRVRRMASDAQDEVRRELGPEFADLNLADLDPRKFVSKHLFDIGLDDDDDEPPSPAGVAAGPAVNGAVNGTSHRVSLDKRDPTDDDSADSTQSTQLASPVDPATTQAQAPARPAYDADTT